MREVGALLRDRPERLKRVNAARDAALRFGDVTRRGSDGASPYPRRGA